MHGLPGLRAAGRRESRIGPQNKVAGFLDPRFGELRRNGGAKRPGMSRVCERFFGFGKEDGRSIAGVHMIIGT